MRIGSSFNESFYQLLQLGTFTPVPHPTGSIVAKQRVRRRLCLYTLNKIEGL
jgi:hypothetical protein